MFHSRKENYKQVGTFEENKGERCEGEEKEEDDDDVEKSAPLLILADLLPKVNV